MSPAISAPLLSCGHYIAPFKHATTVGYSDKGLNGERVEIIIVPGMGHARGSVMEKDFTLREGEGGLDRALAILDLITKVPESVSGDEIEGVADFVFPELNGFLTGADLGVY
jgi:hypothetical protein